MQAQAGQFKRRLRCQSPLAAVHGADDVEQFVQQVLEQVSAGAHLHRTQDLYIANIRCENVASQRCGAFPITLGEVQKLIAEVILVICAPLNSGVIPRGRFTRTGALAN